jgi:NAD(P)-dependent dehydrogenase (short-subunit alcohol dehydrogenase family)
VSGGRQDPRAALSLEGRVALVTGASRGIGRAIALALGAAGAAVACIARSLEQAEEAAAEIRSTAGSARAFRMDVTRSADVEAQVAAIAGALGPIDVLVNNAGTILQRKTVEMTDEEWDTLLATNLSSMFRCARAVAPSMIARRRGKIINIGSMWGKLGVPQFAAYCATKAGAEALTRCLAVEWARHNIQVNCLAPGYIRTDFSREAMQEDRTRDLVLSKIPLRRLGEPEEMGPLAVYLASSASDFMTGQTVYIDGGQTITW